MRRNASINSYIIVIALLLILIGVIWEAVRSERILSLQTFSDGAPLTNFTIPDLFHSDKNLTQNDLKGQVCLLNFWASWCAACHKEQDTLFLIRNKYHIPIFGISFKDNPEQAREWLAKHGNPYGVVGVDEFGRVANDFEVYGVPITYIIDKQGNTRYRYLGTLSITAWENEVKPLVLKLEQEK